MAVHRLDGLQVLDGTVPAPDLGQSPGERLDVLGRDRLGDPLRSAVDRASGRDRHDADEGGRRRRIVERLGVAHLDGVAQRVEQHSRPARRLAAIFRHLDVPRTTRHHANAQLAHCLPDLLDVGTRRRIYTRDEYPAVRELLAMSVAALQSRFDELPRIHLRRGAGAYICGEESAMIESIEGKRGMPRLRPPYVAEVGLFGRPTLEHNAETLYWVRDIVDKGAHWFAGQGRNGRKGLRSFSVSGRVNQPGVHLAPAGITVRELIDEHCGGMLDGHAFYGYFPGGASGGILPASLGDVPLDFDTLQPHGSFIGSAAVIILSDRDRARDAALNAMRFFAHESCGQCTPCRVGTEKAAALMAQPDWDRELLEDLCQVMEDASICGLGQAAPNPLRTALKYFPDEFE